MKKEQIKKCVKLALDKIKEQDRKQLEEIMLYFEKLSPRLRNIFLKLVG